METLIHDFIESRVENSNPKNDIIQLGYDPDAIYNEIITNENLTINMFKQIIESNFGLMPSKDLADYAMTFFIFGICIEKERHDGQANDFPETSNEPA